MLPLRLLSPKRSFPRFHSFPAHKALLGLILRRDKASVSALLSSLFLAFSFIDYFLIKDTADWIVWRLIS